MNTEQDDSTPRRAQARAMMKERILVAGRRQLAERGAASLSVREICRELGVVSSAVYRYVRNRDELLTWLVIDSHTQLADTVETAVAAVPSSATPYRHLCVLADAMRKWALDHPQQWGLVGGTPVPGYEAPAEQTSAVGSRLIGQVAAIVASASTDAPDPPPVYAGFLRAGVEELGHHLDPARAAWTVRIWCLLVGTINMEVFAQLGPEIRQSPELGEAVMEETLRPLKAILEG